MAMEIDNLCMNCFEQLKSGSVCQACSYDNDTVVDTMYIQPKTILNERYVVGTVIEHVSDSCVYNGYDTQLDTVVEIREFLPKGIANRLEGNKDVHVRERYRASFENYKQSFLKLWRTIIKMRGYSAVIPTYDVFEENGTAYAVCDKIRSMTLREFLLRSPDGNILWEQARIMFMPVLTTLEALHSNGIIHGSITPDNLLLCPDGKVRLKGFSIAEANNISSDLEFNANEGYTALEQYDNKHKMCPATDIYAFSACIFRALVGQNPPDSKLRETNDKLMIPNTIAENIPTYVIKALGGGLQIYPERRTQSVNDFREQLNASPNVVVANAPEKETQEEKKQTPENKESEYQDYLRAQQKKKKSNAPKIIIAVLVVLIAVAAVAGVLIVRNGGLLNQDETTTTPVSVATYTVPDFTSQGYTQSDIQNNGTWNKQFKITFNSDYSKDVEEGIVFKQSIQQGETVDEGTEIILTVSKGVKTEIIPDVGGLTEKEARETLEKLGFTVTTVEIYNDDNHTEGTVKASYGVAPSVGEEVAVGEEVIIQVYGEVVTTTEPSTEAETVEQTTE